jgi:hypothetical protein
VTASAAQALATARAKVGHANDRGMCLREIRGLYGIPGGISDASAAWSNALGKHTGTPPPGAPVFWTGGSHGHGHIAIMDHGGYIISTDAPNSGRWGRVPLAWPGQRWGVHLQGWAEGWNHVRIPGLPPAAAPAPAPAPGQPSGATVTLANLHYGAVNDDVKDLQNALNAHHLAGGRTLPVTGKYLDMTDAEVIKCQVQHGFGHDAPKHSFLGARQAAHLGLRAV